MAALAGRGLAAPPHMLPSPRGYWGLVPFHVHYRIARPPAGQGERTSARARAGQGLLVWASRGSTMSDLAETLPSRTTLVQVLQVLQVLPTTRVLTYMGGDPRWIHLGTTVGRRAAAAPAARPGRDGGRVLPRLRSPPVAHCSCTSTGHAEGTT